MASIVSFNIEGLAGRKDACALSLNETVNVFFGPNGSGKTSLLRILHSALSNDAEILREVPFTRATVVIHSWVRAIDFTYSLDRTLKDQPPPRGTVPTIGGALRRPKRVSWQIEPETETKNWFHKYLPTSRIYASLAATTTPYYALGETAPLSEDALEAQFAQSLTQIWKDYSADVARRVNKAQEAGLARILEAVILRSAPAPDEKPGDPAEAYRAVSNFLSRRGMESVSLSENEFLARYATEPQLRSVALDIESVESEIAHVTQPREDFRRLANEMFFGGKLLNFTEKGDIEVAIGDKKIGLSTLSSGEKQLLRIFVETLAAGASMILVDEPELSMHVEWQRKLISSMQVLNPTAQMIFATHSPEVMADVPDNQIFRL
jgi:predicted ATPase